MRTHALCYIENSQGHGSVHFAINPLLDKVKKLKSLYYFGNIFSVNVPEGTGLGYLTHLSVSVCEVLGGIDVPCNMTVFLLHLCSVVCVYLNVV